MSGRAFVVGLVLAGVLLGLFALWATPWRATVPVGPPGAPRTPAVR